jgi:integrase
VARGHVSDTWHKTVDGQRARTDRYGRGLRWQAVWNDPATGRERTKAFKLKPDAESHVVAMQASQMRGEYIDPKAGKVTLGAYAKQWSASRPYGPSAATQREIHLRVHIEPTFGPMPLASILPSSVQAWLADLPGSETTKKHVLATLAQVLTSAVDDGLIRSNPAKARSVKAPRPARVHVEPWTVAQVRSVAAQMHDRYQILTLLGAGLGLRSGEAYALALEDIDWLRRTVTIRRQVRLDENKQRFALPKFEHVREVPLPDAVGTAIAAHLQTYPAREVTLPWASREAAENDQPHTVQLIVTTPEGKALNKNQVARYVWRPALLAAEIPVIRSNGFHVLRHTFASTLLDGGVSIRGVAAYLGHSDPAFTLRVYAHLMPDTEVRARSVVDAAWSSRGASAERDASEAAPVQVSEV